LLPAGFPALRLSASRERLAYFASGKEQMTINVKLSLTILIASVLTIGPVHGQQEKIPASSGEPSTPETIKQFNDDRVAELSKQIAGKETQPAGTVFKNIKIFTEVPAGNLLKIMQMGFSRSLGVSCAHCHVAGQWEKDDKVPKQIARDMSKMDRAIVSDMLKNIEGLKDRNPVINCTTCHRGQLKPALSLDASAAK
jgi:hypothetical protein